MRVEIGHDALDRSLFEDRFGQRFDVIAPNAAEHLVEQPVRR